MHGGGVGVQAESGFAGLDGSDQTKQIAVVEGEQVSSQEVHWPLEHHLEQG